MLEHSFHCHKTGMNPGLIDDGAGCSVQLRTCEQDGQPDMDAGRVGKMGMFSRKNVCFDFRERFDKLLHNRRI